MSHYTVMEVRGWEHPQRLPSPGTGGGGAEPPWTFPPAHGFPAQRDAGRGRCLVGMASQGVRAFVSVQAGPLRKSQDQRQRSQPRLTENSLGSLDRQVSKTHVQRF